MKSWYSLLLPVIIMTQGFAGIIAHWNFDDPATFALRDKWNNVYQLLDEENQLIRDKTSLTLEGAQYLAIEMPDGYFLHEEFSISFWIKTTATSPQTIISYQNHEGFFSLKLLEEKGGIAFTVSDFKSGLGDRTVTGYKIKPQDGQWHHVVGVKYQSHMTLYFDGRELPTKLYREFGDSYTQKEDNEILIGGDRKSPYEAIENFYKGEIDEMIIFGKALSPHEVHTMYLNSLVGNQENVPAKKYFTIDKYDIYLESSAGPVKFTSLGEYPMGGVIHIKLNDPLAYSQVGLTVWNGLGKEVYNENAEDVPNLSLNTNEVFREPGVYLLNFHGSSASLTRTMRIK